MNPCKYTWFICPSFFFPDGSDLVDLAKTSANDELIDDLKNLQDDNVYIFSGLKDKTIVTKVVDSTSDFYHALGLSDLQVFIIKRLKPVMHLLPMMPLTLLAMLRKHLTSITVISRRQRECLPIFMAY